MIKERKKICKVSLIGFLLSFITPLSLLFVSLYVTNNPDDGFPVLLLWSVIGFWFSQAAHTVSEIGIILCAVKKRRGIALSVIGIVICQLIMWVAVIVFCVLFLHESPPMPVN